MRGRGPVNLVWWILASGVVLAVMLDNPMDWDRELLQERESRLAMPSTITESTLAASTSTNPWRGLLQ